MSHWCYQHQLPCVHLKHVKCGRSLLKLNPSYDDDQTLYCGYCSQYVRQDDWGMIVDAKPEEKQ